MSEHLTGCFQVARPPLSGCRRDWRRHGGIRLIGSFPAKRRMRPLAVVETQIPADRRAGLRDAGVGSEVDLLVFDRPPEPLDEDVVAPSRSWPRQCVIWFGCTSNCWASSASVFSPLMAAIATFALKAGLWFRRGRFRHGRSSVLGNLLTDLERLHHSAPLSRFPEPPLAKYGLQPSCRRTHPHPGHEALGLAVEDQGVARCEADPHRPRRRRAPPRSRARAPGHRRRRCSRHRGSRVPWARSARCGRATRSSKRRCSGRSPMVTLPRAAPSNGKVRNPRRRHRLRPRLGSG